MQSSDSALAEHTHDDADFDAFVNRMNARFLANVDGGKRPLLTTDATGLFTSYLEGFSFEHRQFHTCHACRHFVERFGHLVVVDDEGHTIPAIWNVDDAPAHYSPSVAALARQVRTAKVNGVFLSEEKVWGQPITGAWHHMAVVPVPGMVFKRKLLTAGQAIAEKKEDFKTVNRALEEFTQPMLKTALSLLSTESLYRSEKVIGPAQWLHDLHTARGTAKKAGGSGSALIWRAIATAPAGFCHPRSSMVGTLLEDIAGGLAFDDVSRRFAAKMQPHLYQRPTALPTAGAIAAAEQVMEKLGAAGALARRYCRVDEVQAIWRPAPAKAEPAAAGVFGHLTPKDKGPAQIDMKIPPITMTWAKFQVIVLPTAETIECLVPTGRAGFAVMLTAANPDAPPILQWDHEDARNPVSVYQWTSGSYATQFGLTAGKFHPVSAVAFRPHMWDATRDMAHQGQGLLLILDGAKETVQSGAALFPEILKAEFHGIRSVIEAYSAKATIDGMDQPHAVGISLNKGSDWDVRVRVTTDGRAVDYKLDRWD